MAKRDLMTEHCQRALDELPKPFAYLVVELMEANEREWLDEKPDTYGAESVRQTGLTTTQKEWVKVVEYRLAEIEHNEDP